MDPSFIPIMSCRRRTLFKGVSFAVGGRPILGCQPCPANPQLSVFVQVEGPYDTRLGHWAPSCRTVVMVGGGVGVSDEERACLSHCHCGFAWGWQQERRAIHTVHVLCGWERAHVWAQLHVATSPGPARQWSWLGVVWV